MVIVEVGSNNYEASTHLAELSQESTIEYSRLHQYAKPPQNGRKIKYPDPNM
jgi:hypothetical protein